MTFGTVAQQVGVGEFWPGGSKEKALVRMFTRTLEERPSCFEKLVVTIVREGLTYRRRTNPITKSDILDLNDVVKKIGFKFPDLWDPVFLDSLAAKQAPKPESPPASPPPSLAEHRRKLDDFRVRFYSLAAQKDRAAAGIAFQKLFGDLLDLFGLHPKPAFRVTGEEMDGYFILDNETYLLETKWEAGRLSEAPLLVFREKVAGRSNVTRGVFVSMNGFTDECLDAITRGKQPNFFLVDGYDVTQVIEGHIDLPTLLREKLRLFAAKGLVLARVEAAAVGR